jgi:hypothetical protein
MRHLSNIPPGSEGFEASAAFTKPPPVPLGSVRIGPARNADALAGDALEEMAIDIAAAGLRARWIARARNVLGGSMRAAVSVFVITLPAILLLLVAPAQAPLIIAGWFVLSCGVVALAYLAGSD